MPAIIRQFAKTEIPDIQPGDTVVVHHKIVEGGKERIQAFEGVVVKVKKPQSLDGSFTVRKISFGVGVEKNYPLVSPNIVKINFKKGAKVRRARLYYLRELSGKALRLKERKTTKKTWKPQAEKAPASVERPMAEETKA